MKNVAGFEDKRKQMGEAEEKAVLDHFSTFRFTVLLLKPFPCDFIKVSSGVTIKSLLTCKKIVYMMSLFGNLCDEPFQVPSSFDDANSTINSC